MSHPIETSRLRSIPLDETDFEELRALHRDERVVGPAGPLTDDETREWLDEKLAHWREHGFGVWMFRDEEGEFVGRCGIHRAVVDGREEVELGYIVRSELWSNGYATEMAAAVVNHAFSALALPELVGFTLPDNLGSRRVLEKLDFSYEKSFVSNGRPTVLYRRRAARVSLVRFPIETERLLLRPLVPEDARDLHEVYGDAEAMRFLTARVPATVNESLEWAQNKITQQERDGISLWAVVERRSGRVIGDCGLQYLELDERREVEIGCRLARASWGKGYGAEAGAACLRVGFEQLRLPRIISITHVDNAAARRSLEKMGMAYQRDVDWLGTPMALYAVTAGRRA